MRRGKLINVCAIPFHIRDEMKLLSHRRLTKVDVIVEEKEGIVVIGCRRGSGEGSRLM